MTYTRQQNVLAAQQLADVRRLISEGKTNDEIAKLLGVCTRTVARKVKKVMDGLANENVSQVIEWRDELIEELYQARLEVELHREPGKALGQKFIQTLLSIIALDAKLKGAFAPDRQITANIKVDTAVQYQFLEHAAGLTQEQIAEVFAFMDALPRPKTVIDISAFPIEPKALPEVTDDHQS